MILNLIRTIILLLLIIIIIIDIPYIAYLKNSTTQLFIAFIILIIFFVIDYFIGFIFALIILTIYFKNNKILLNKKELFSDKSLSTIKDDKKPLQTIQTNIINDDDIKNDKVKLLVYDYISPELLDKAQNNIFDIDNYNKKINDKFDVQGLDNIEYENINSVFINKF